MRTLSAALACTLAAALLLAGCDRPQGGLKGQTNTTVTFYGLVVDQDGRPLRGVRVVYRVEAYPRDWSFATRDRPHDIWLADVTTDERGRFQFTATGCNLRRERVSLSGYSHLAEEHPGGDIGFTYGYRLIAWSDIWFRTDPENPAVYVMVKDGVRTVSALPSRGGFDWQGGDRWRRNDPVWPREPSLKDVVYVAPATQPSTQPVTQPSTTSPARE